MSVSAGPGGAGFLRRVRWPRWHRRSHLRGEPPPRQPGAPRVLQAGPHRGAVPRLQNHRRALHQESRAGGMTVNI